MLLSEGSGRPRGGRPVSRTAPEGAWPAYVAGPGSVGAVSAPHVPIRMLNDRLLVSLDGEPGERRSNAGILIPATAAVGKRLAWATVVAAGQHVRQVEVGDRVLFDPEERAEVELGGATYLLLREKDVHAVAEPDGDGDGPGLYL